MHSLQKGLANCSSGSKSGRPPASPHEVLLGYTACGCFRVQRRVHGVATDCKACKAKNMKSLTPTESLLTSAPQRAHEVTNHFPR